MLLDRFVFWLHRILYPSAMERVPGERESLFGEPVDLDRVPSHWRRRG